MNCPKWKAKENDRMRSIQRDKSVTIWVIQAEATTSDIFQINNILYYLFILLSMVMTNKIGSATVCFSCRGGPQCEF